jgi:D-glycero-alpha-D-manno-heptose-7-phosphate kinase
MIVSRAPLRISFAGGGSDLEPYVSEHGGCVLSYTFNRYAFCKISSNVSMHDDVWEFHASDLRKSVKFEKDLDITYPYKDNDCNISINAYLYFVKNFNIPISPVSIITRCDAVSGSGLGSSSALTVAVVSSLAKYHNVPLSDYDIATVSFDIERNICKFPGGKQDQYASAFGGCNFIEFKNNNVIVNPLRLSKSISNRLEMNFLLFYTGHTRKEHVIERNIEKLTNDSTSVELTHKIKENCYKFKDALLKNDFYTMDELLQENWNIKKSISSSITTQKIEEIYEFGLRNGMKSGKLCGAGGGGHILFLCDQFADMSKWIQSVDKLKELHQGTRIVPYSFVNNGVETWNQ